MYFIIYKQKKVKNIMIIDNAKGYDSQKLTIFNYKFFS